MKKKYRKLTLYLGTLIMGIGMVTFPIGEGGTKDSKNKGQVEAVYFLLFIVTLLLGLAVTVSFCVFIYVLTFFTISPQGLRMLFSSCVDFFAGAVIPLPFFPENRNLYRMSP